MGHIRLSIGRHLYRIFHRFLTIRSAREACWYSKNIAFECLESFNIEGMTPCIRLNEDLVSWDFRNSLAMPRTSRIRSNAGYGMQR